MDNKKKILFLCTTNSCRSQMAEGILKTLACNEFEVHSAGAKASSVHPLAIKVMDERGIDISKNRSKSVEEFIGEEFDYVITVCGDYAKDVCPVFPGRAKKRLYWNFVDPAQASGKEGKKLKVFREVRDQIKTRIEEFINQLKELRS